MMSGKYLDDAHELTIEDLRFDPPEFALGEIRKLAKKHYGIEGEFTALDGERDQNHRVRCADGRQFVFKISGISEPREVVEMQVEALCHIEQVDSELPVPRMIRSQDGRIICTAQSESGTHMIRLLSWLPGILYQDGPFPSPRGLQDLGGFIARLGNALRDFKHPATRHFMPWNMANGLVFSEQLRDLMPAELDAWLPDCFERLQTIVYPRLKELRWQVIHQDAHGANLLRESKESEAVTGVIDFGDIVHGPLICDLAACVSDLMDPAIEPVKAAQALCLGYHRVTPLFPEELELVLDLVLVRHIMVLQLFEFRRRNMEQPPDFVTDDQPVVIANLQRLAAINPQDFANKLKESVKNG